MQPILPFLSPLWAALAAPAYALLRITAGGFLIPHGLWKLFGITGSQEEIFGHYGITPAGLAETALALLAR